jgi:tripartite-type tricarboxylate transporter receptor subunit TctC
MYTNEYSFDFNFRDLRQPVRSRRGLQRRDMKSDPAICILAALAACLAGPSAHAQSVADFYRGKTIAIIVGSDTGGGYDLNARTLARHWARHVPGNPNIIVQNKPGAGSMTAANYVYEAAPKDGTVIAAVQRPIPFQQLLGDAGVRYDPRRMQWLGSTSNELGVVVVWHTAPQKTAQDLFATETIVGGNGAATDTELFARAFNNVLGTKFKIVGGYPGQAQIVLAMERGEVQGIANWSWSDIEKGKPDWLRDRKLRLLVQLDLKKGSSPYLRDVPLATDLARNQQERQVFEILMGMKALGRPYFVAPEVPKDRSEALREAFMATMKDPEFLAEAARTLGSIDPVSGAEMQKILADAYALPPDVIAKARDAVKVAKAN